MNHIASQVDELAAMFENLNVADAPNYRVMCAFKQALVKQGLFPLLAERVVANMEVSVSERVLVEAEASVHTLIDRMAHMVCRMYDQIQKDFETDPSVILISMTKGINLKLEY